MEDKTFHRTLILIFTIIFTFCASIISGQKNGKISNPSFKYSLSPGFVNITDLTGAIGLENTDAINTKYFFGLTNIFGYQIDRNIFGGIGIGFYIYDTDQLIPFFVENTYNIYLKSITPFIYGDAGVLINPGDFMDGSKIFVNPGFGISRKISKKLEARLSAGMIIQARSMVTDATFVNFKFGIIYRKNTQMLFRKK
jgi:hypothetical protein